MLRHGCSYLIMSDRDHRSLKETLITTDTPFTFSLELTLTETNREEWIDDKNPTIE